MLRWVAAGSARDVYVYSGQTKNKIVRCRLYFGGYEYRLDVYIYLYLLIKRLDAAHELACTVYLVSVETLVEELEFSLAGLLVRRWRYITPALGVPLTRWIVGTPYDVVDKRITLCHPTPTGGHCHEQIFARSGITHEPWVNLSVAQRCQCLRVQVGALNVGDLSLAWHMPNGSHSKSFFAYE